ncbi:hypothetical protein B9479_001068 [Cryptococcus floricola]|uniref:Uncharacterized protein n=1 Tax=Cryptococcus floricola TaxID=2591691 RepID=A0A5D3B7V0_9TREE|nr:hypothetical protein B9479_001068 [Cryptococcus floricola]
MTISAPPALPVDSPTPTQTATTPTPPDKPEVPPTSAQTTTVLTKAPPSLVEAKLPVVLKDAYKRFIKEIASFFKC